MRNSSKEILAIIKVVYILILLLFIFFLALILSFAVLIIFQVKSTNDIWPFYTAVIVVCLSALISIAIYKRTKSKITNYLKVNRRKVSNNYEANLKALIKVLVEAGSIKKEFLDNYHKEEAIEQLENLKVKANDVVHAICKEYAIKKSTLQFGATETAAIHFFIYEVITEIYSLFYPNASLVEKLLFYVHILKLLYANNEVFFDLSELKENQKIAVENSLKILAIDVLSSLPGLSKFADKIIDSSGDVYVIAKAGYLSIESLVNYELINYKTIIKRAELKSWEMSVKLTKELIEDTIKLSANFIGEKSSAIINEALHKFSEKIKNLFKKEK